MDQILIGNTLKRTKSVNITKVTYITKRAIPERVASITYEVHLVIIGVIR